MRETLAQAKHSPVWSVAFVAALVMPFMLVFARAGGELCVGLIGLLFLYHSMRTKEWSWLRAPFTLLCLLVWVWLLVGVTPLAVTPKTSFLTAIAWMRMPLMFAALRYWVLAKPAARTTLAVVLAVFLVLIALDCIWQFFTGMSLSGHAIMAYDRLTGPFRAPKVGAFLAKMAVPVWALCFVALPAWRGKTVGAVICAAAMVLAAIVLSGERAAFLGTLLACGTVVGLLMLAEKHARVWGAVVCVAVVALVALLYFTNPAIQVRGAAMLQVMLHYQQSAYGLLAGAGFTLGAQHWLHGVGLGGFNDLCPLLVYDGREFRGMHPHHYYAEWFAETGLPGLLLFIGLIGLLAREAVQHWRRGSGLSRVMPTVALGLLLQHFFPLMSMQSFFGNWSAMLQWYTMALAFAALPREHAHG